MNIGTKQIEYDFHLFNPLQTYNVIDYVEFVILHS